MKGSSTFVHVEAKDVGALTANEVAEAAYRLLAQIDGKDVELVHITPHGQVLKIIITMEMTR